MHDEQFDKNLEVKKMMDVTRVTKEHILTTMDAPEIGQDYMATRTICRSG
jgi:hypothetical protein